MPLTKVERSSIVAGCLALIAVATVAVNDIRRVSAAGQQAATMKLQSNGPLYSGATFTLPGGATVATTAMLPTKLSQLTNDTGFVAPLPAVSTTFSATSLLAIGTYGPNTLTIPGATAGMAVQCNLVNFTSTNYAVTGTVTAANTVLVYLNVSTPLTTNTTAPIGRCKPY